MDLGVIVGRFQVPEMHDGQRLLIDHVMRKHQQTLVLLGVSEGNATRENPLDYITREKMLKEQYPDLSYLALPDMPRDEDWSDNLDGIVKMVCPVGSATIYGGRDSFIPYYSGKYSTKEIDLNQTHSGTNLRETAANKIEISSDFRKGIIYSVYNQYPKVYPTVDIAVVQYQHGVVMGKKRNSKLWQFPGGFVDSSDESLEAAAKRELKEETGLDALNLSYLVSSRVDDWRYHNNDAKIITTLFLCERFEGNLKASDDLDAVQYISLSTSIDRIAKIHQQLFQILQRHYV